METDRGETTCERSLWSSCCSLDGVAEDPNRFFTEWDDVVDANMPRTITTQDGVILGRRTYEELAGSWPGSDIEPFASFINRVTKHVATSKQLEPKWTKARVIDGELLEFARRLKESPGGDIGRTAASRSPRRYSPVGRSTNCGS
jgi:dihydrofolate reductase